MEKTRATIKNPSASRIHRARSFHFARDSRRIGAWSITGWHAGTPILFALLFLYIFSPVGLAAANSNSIQSVSVETLQTWMKQNEKLTIIDAGALLVCMDAKIPGALCLPCDDENEAGLPKDGKIVFYSAYDPLDEKCALMRRASSTGTENIYILDGGLSAWRKAGHSVFAEKRIPRVAGPAIKAQHLSAWKESVKNYLVIDIRSPEAFSAKHLEGAKNIPLTRLHLEYADIALDRTLLIVDEDGRSAFLAASYLARKGFSQVTRLQGGMAAYERRAQ